MELDSKAIFLNDLDGSLALEIVVRTLIMFSFILIFLRLTGKKGVRQLSIFEVAIIIGLGSAAGDPMFNADAAILPALLVFATILGLYRLVTWLTAHSERFERLVEGEPLYIVEEGQFALLNASDQTYAKDEFFAEMRQQNIEHVGQVQTAILETNGNVSFFFYTDEQVRPGLPILPKAYQQKSALVDQAGQYACATCGTIEAIAQQQHTCPRCHKTEWVKAINTCRRT